MICVRQFVKQGPWLDPLVADAHACCAHCVHGLASNEAQVAQGVVVFGRTVRVRNLDLDEEEVFTLVGPHESDFDSGRISVDSPIGKGLLGKKPGDRVEIKVPAGIIRYQIVSID